METALTSSNTTCLGQAAGSWEHRQWEEAGDGHIGVVTESHCSGGLQKVAASPHWQEVGGLEWPEGSLVGARVSAVGGARCGRSMCQGELVLGFLPFPSPGGCEGQAF